MESPQHPTTGMEPGTVLAGRYELGEPISHGAMGAVTRAHDRDAGIDVAVKKLTDVTQVARFEIEARLLASLAHPRVVAIVDHFNDPSGYFLVMELVTGKDLGRVLKDEGTPGLDVDLVLDYAHQTCEALDYVHEQRIVHRDIKPENLILSNRGVTVVDFGVARELGVEDEGEATTGTIGVGTPRFMAPEIFAGGAVSERSDVFSLGTTIFTLIAGELPSYGDRRSLSDRAEGVTPELDAALRAAMEFLPERRLATIDAFAKALGRPVREREGLSLAHSIEPDDGGPPSLMRAVVRTPAGVFDAAAVSLALVDEATEELVFQASWGAGAEEIVGVRLARGTGLAGSVATSGDPLFVADCRNDERFAASIAANTGYVPNTMLIVPLKRHDQTVGVMSVLDRRDGGAYGGDDVSRATLFAELAVAALEHGDAAKLT